MFLFTPPAKRILPIALVLPFSLYIVLLGCGTTEPSSPDYVKGTKEGYELAKFHCSTCHGFTPADALDKKTWKHNVLPPMGRRMGLTLLWDTVFVPLNDNFIGGITNEEWNKIVKYYEKNAPDKLVIPEPEQAVTRDTGIFHPKLPAKLPLSEESRTVMTIFDTITNHLYTSDFFSNTITKWNQRLEPIDSIKGRFAVVHAKFYTDSHQQHHGLFTNIGSLNPRNNQSGSLFDITFDQSKNANHSEGHIIAKALARPVHTSMADMNNDGLTDYVVCEFGHQSTGKLQILEQQQNNTLKEIPVSQYPGAIKSVIRDFNNDGWNDIIVLFAHDYESIKLFTNNRDGTFTETILLSFPPVYGSTSFQLVDFNGDGLDDILYTCGDNTDVSVIFKPYHGVYIFINKGNNKYQQEYFYQINGCIKAIAADFDNDGDLDIATIAFHANFEKRPGEGFQYFEQVSPMSFKVNSPPIEKYGRWWTMDVHDFDGDGDLDIVLGNFAKEAVIEKIQPVLWDRYLPFIFLENKTR